MIFDYNSGHLWRIRKKTNKLYCIGNTNIKHRYFTLSLNGKTEYLHRIIYSNFHNIPLQSLGVIDHKDRNTQNNSITNLRLVTYSENNSNTKRRVDNKSGFKNIHFDKCNNIWVFTGINKKVCKNTIEEVIEYRNNYYKESYIYFGEITDIPNEEYLIYIEKHREIFKEEKRKRVSFQYKKRKI